MTESSLNTVEAKLRDEIVRGVVAPGAKLKLVPLTERYGVGRGLLREAACRLSGEGLVVLENQRGVRVAPISRDDLVDVTRTRQRIESLALRDSIDHGDVEWEGRVLASLHVLDRTSEIDDTAEGRRAFSDAHRAFHDALCSACPSVYLLQFRQVLYAHSERYRLLAAERYRDRVAARPVHAEHRELTEAVVRRDADLACALLRTHLQRTADTLIEGYPDLFGAL